MQSPVVTAWHEEAAHVHWQAHLLAADGPSTDADLFGRCVERYQGDRWVKSFRCVEHYRCMAFAQLTYRESLRDIEACLRAQGAKLYHMGIRGAVSRSTLADANEQRDWRIYADFAQRLIHTARRLYVDDALALELDETVYALDSSTIDLCLTLFPWADFRKTKAAVKLHTLLDLRGSIPAFIHISTGKLHDVNVMDLLMPEAGAFYVMDRAYVDFARLHTLHRGARLLRRARQIQHSAAPSLLAPRSTAPPGSSATRPSCSPASPRPTAIPTSCGASRSATPSEARPWSS